MWGSVIGRLGGWDLGLGRELGYVFWGMIFVEAAFGAYVGVWPLWIEELGAPVTIVGLVLGSAGLLRLLAIAPAAGLAERFGARRLIVAARVAAGIGMVGAAIATHWTQLFVMVLGSAIGEMAFPLAQSHVVAHAGERRVRAFTLVFTVGPAVAFGLGPLIAGGLVAVWGIRAAFLFAALCTAVSIVFFAGIERGTGAAGRARPAASSYKEALADAGVRRVLVLQGMTIFALALGTSLVPNFLNDERGMAPSRVSILYSVSAIGTIAFGLGVSRSLRLQRAPFLAVAFAVGAVGTALVTIFATNVLWLILVAFVLRGGFFSAWGLFAAAMGVLAPERHRARAFATAEMLAGAAFSSAPIVAGLLYDREPSLPLITAATVAFALIPLLLRAQLVTGQIVPRVATPRELEAT